MAYTIREAVMQKIMKASAIFFCAAAALLALLQHYGPSPLRLSLSITAAAFAYHFTMRLLVGLAFDKVMKNRADLSKPWYSPRPWEKSLYKKLRVKSWKGRMPSYEPGLFDPKKHSWDEIAQAMCQSELVHETIVLLSFMPILAAIPFGAFPVFFVTSLLAAAFDLHFVILQRYNRPRIMKLIKR